MDIFTPPSPQTVPPPEPNTETQIPSSETQSEITSTAPTKKSHIQIIIVVSLLLSIILGIVFYYYFKNQDRQNGYYGTYTLNFETEEISAQTDDYVVTMGGDRPISVGVNLKGVNTENLVQVTYFCENPNNDTILDTRILSGADDTQYFAIPRSGGDYLFGAKLQYKDGSVIQSSDYFSGPILTIWPDLTNDMIPLVSLKTDKHSTSLQDEVTFTVITKIKSPNDADFQANKQVLRDFDGDGTRDRKSQGTSTRYRYTQSYGILQYSPKVAVVYKGFTGTAVGIPITIK